MYALPFLTISCKVENSLIKNTQHTRMFRHFELGNCSSIAIVVRT